MSEGLSAVVIARDEEKNIGPCLAGLAFCDEIVVVDSGSADATAEIARRAGARVIARPFDDFASQKNFAVSQATRDWVLLVDADERVGPELAREIRECLKHPAADGYTIPRVNRIFGRVLRHGADSNDRPLRLARRAKAVFEGRVHERIAMPPERVGRLRAALAHESTRTVKDYLRKLNAYTSLEAQALAERGDAFDVRKACRRPPAVFLYRQVLRRGFLDGTEGFLFNVLSGYYEFVRRAKQWELERNTR